MSNRTMKQKALKLRKQRRAWAKPYGRPSGITVNTAVLHEYQNRVHTLGIPEYEIDELIKKLYKRDAIHGMTAGQKEVNDLLAELKRKVPEMLFFSILDTSYHKCICFFNSQKTCFVLFHTDIRKQITRRSIEYATKDRALHVWNTDKVTWVSYDRVSAPP